MFRYRHILVVTTLGAVIARPVSADMATQGGRPAVVLAENGLDAEKRPVFSLTTKSAEITEVLRAIFVKLSAEFVIDQDVSGPVDLNLKNRTLDELLMQVRESARPPIKIAKEGKVFHVSRDYELEMKALAVQNRINQSSGGFGGGQLVQPSGQGAYGGNAQMAIPSDKFVSLSIPESRPISLSQALARISAQTGFPIMLDKRVPQDVKFAGTIETSLNLALPALAQTAGLQMVVTGGQVVFAPTPEFTLRVNNMLLGQSGGSCQRCRQPVWSSWSFCPNCGQITQRGIQQQMQNQYNQIRPRSGTNNPVRKIDR